MGGMAIVLAFAGSKLFETLRQQGKEHSYFIKLVATFFHFILVQTVAIMLGLAGKAYCSSVLAFFGYWAMCYAILATISTAGQLFNTARIANYVSSVDDDK